MDHMNYGMKLSNIIKEIESYAPVTDVKQWHKDGYIYITVKCPSTDLFRKLSYRYDNHYPSDRTPSEKMMICR